MFTKTAESVCIGHPDKLCDLIADQILDDALFEDRKARCAIEVMATGRKIIVAGEVATTRRLRVRDSVRTALARAGYKPWQFLIYVFVRRQSEDIANGVTQSLEAREGAESTYYALGAGDQGTVYGYATGETPQRLPLPLVLSHEICKRLDTARSEGVIDGIGCDGKAQVTVSYDDTGVPVHVDTVVVSIQHDKNKDLAELEQEIRTLVINPACKDYPLTGKTQVLINPSGRFVKGGPGADCGLTGRKLAVDTYGGLALHGGGAFSGKDASKVDRSGAYMARLIAKTIVDAGLAKECQVSISYAIGRAEPVAFNVDTLGTGEYADSLLSAAAVLVFPLTPSGIIDALCLRNPGLAQFATYGHFHGQPAWENTKNHVGPLLKAVSGLANPNSTR